jgi:hypothetical protein
VPVPLVSLALRRWRPLVRWQMAEMIPNDLPMKRGWSTAPHGPLTTFGQTRSQDALAQVLHRLVRRRAARRPAAPLHARPYLRLYHRYAPSPISAGQPRRAASPLFGGTLPADLLTAAQGLARARARRCLPVAARAGTGASGSDATFLVGISSRRSIGASSAPLAPHSLPRHCP